MNASPENSEIRNILQGEGGSDVLASLPLIEAQMESLAFLRLLRQWSADVYKEVERKFNCDNV
jgi:hypothetical protein